MISHRRSRWIGLPGMLLFIAGLPLLVGQGCPNPGSDMIPLNPGRDVSDSGTGTGEPDNYPPFLEFTSPLQNIVREVGDQVLITWADSDTDNSAVITLMLDPDKLYGNGNEILIEAAILEDDDGDGDSYVLDTSTLDPAEYRIIARINDGVNPEEIVVAAGLLQLFAPGMVPGNRSPVVFATQPDRNLAVGHDDTVPVEWCASDPDDGENGDIPDIVILVDLDDDPWNDLDLSGLGAEEDLQSICLDVEDGPQPIEVDGVVQAYVIGCVEDEAGGTSGECNNPAANSEALPPDGFLRVDSRQIPLRADGKPYRIRVTMWDHINSPVNSYAPGGFTVTALASGAYGVVDLGQVGKTFSGSRFVGFDAGGLAGSNALGIGDVDGDGADDFVIISRLGRPSGEGNYGSARLVLGLTGGEKFGGEIPLNSVNTSYRGTLFTMPETTGTDGIVSITRVGDVDNDGIGEFMFGMPYVESFPDLLDDDPMDDDTVCYGDTMPNPLSTSGNCDHMSGWDWREGGIAAENEEDPAIICSNDLDLLHSTPIDGGYTVLVSSRNGFEASVISLRLVGQYGLSSPYGARFRGPWYPFYPDDLDYSQAEKPFGIVTDNEFGRSVASMPDITDTSPGTTPLYGPALMISAPKSLDERGVVVHVISQDFTSFAGGDDCAVQSIPIYVAPGRIQVFPGDHTLVGARAGDHFGYGSGAGDFNLDGSQDFLCGAPGADRDGLRDNGIVYIIYGRRDFPAPFIDMEEYDPPRMEIHGENSFDRFGEMQRVVGDMNNDGLPDIAFASQYAATSSGSEAGWIGVIYGGRLLTGENVFTVDQVGGPQLPGFKIYGSQAGGHAGASLKNAGDINGDGWDDMLILAPDETRIVSGQTRKGVAYAVFGGSHLDGAEISLADVGSTVPGIVFVSPYAVGTADAATLSCAAPAGDVNGDGFDDILIGVEGADYVSPLDPNQRRIDAGECYLIYGSNSGTNVVTSQ